jgi:hypothetical protein
LTPGRGGLTGIVLEPERGMHHVRFWSTADLGLQLALIASDANDPKMVIDRLEILQCSSLRPHRAVPPSRTAVHERARYRPLVYHSRKKLSYALR